MHKHKVKSFSPDRCFDGPVSADENPAAHGGIAYDEFCECGAVRTVNVNGNYIEEGAWTPAEC